MNNRQQRFRAVCRHRQRGSAMLESLFGIFFLLFVFGCLLQVFQWIAREMVTDYAAFYGAKAVALGYAGENCRKATRLGATGISGRDISTSGRVSLLSSTQDALRHQARRYMTMGEGSGVNFEYWRSDFGSNTQLNMNFDGYSETATARVRLTDAPLLLPVMGKIMALQNGEDGAPDPVGEHPMYNYAKLLLEN